MNYKITVSEAITKGKSLGPLTIHFNEIYTELDQSILELEKLVDDSDTCRPIAFLEHEELKNLSANEKSLINMYNNEIDQINEEEFRDVNKFVKSLIFRGGIIGVLEEKISQEVYKIFDAGDFKEI